MGSKNDVEMISLLWFRPWYICPGECFDGNSVTWYLWETNIGSVFLDEYIAHEEKEIIFSDFEKLKEKKMVEPSISWKRWWNLLFHGKHLNDKVTDFTRNSCLLRIVEHCRKAIFKWTKSWMLHPRKF